MLKNKLVIGSFALVVVLLIVFVAKGISPKEVDKDLDEGIITESEDLLPNDEVGSPESVKGSCDLIDRGSTCVEYFGSYWNAETIKLVCEEGTYSAEGCPESSLGGCRIMPGSETDMVTWHYDYGADPFTESLPYAIQACNSVPGGTWVEED